MSRLHSDGIESNATNLKGVGPNLTDQHNISYFRDSQHPRDKFITSSIANSRDQAIILEDKVTSSNDLTNSNITPSNMNMTGQDRITSDNYWMEMPKLDNFVDVFSLCCSTAVIFGGLIPYIPQYLKIKQSMSSDGFSTYVCLTLLIANILRIAFWFGHHFEIPLLIQSFVMIVGMLAMMDMCVRVKENRSSYMISSIYFRPTAANRRRSLIGSILRNFWDWDDFSSYIKFLTFFSTMIGLLTYSLIDNHLYIESLGFVAVFTESMLGIPQLFRNYAKKSTRGMSVEMVVMWFSGDMFKTLYFIIRHAPTQFVACGSIQVTLDILILLQVFWYRGPHVGYRKLPKST